MVTYQDLGLKKIVNAAGTYTRLGGSLMHPEVLTTMAEAARSFVDIKKLMVKSGDYLADLLGVEAAMVTAGAASGLTLATAACIAGEDLKYIHKLPETGELPHEIIVLRCHRNPYDQAISAAGGQFKEVGNAIENELYQLESAIDENTAAIAFFVQSEMFEASLSLEEVIEIGHSADVPVIVDAAAELPPVTNLYRFMDMGADFVLFSGGKELRGPQSSGLMLGKEKYIKKCLLHSYPHHAIGRAMKLDKETIMGFVKAVELYLEEDHQQREQCWQEQTEYIYNELRDISEIEVDIGIPSQPLTQPAVIPRVFIKLKEDAHLNQDSVVQQLYEGEPAIAVVERKDCLVINPHMLQKGDEKIVSKRLKEVINRDN